ncbi:hypothetical protein NXV86_01930 [Bacteroides sp. BFG-257]|uniref:hypothetical protein n=1 Tax=Bacteroides TaxID=816 RepID=UPI001CCE0254|nr:MULTISPECIES: hypothetical protein [Bacteroides]UBD70203.1 hypothetical protein K6V21_01855 [Bacteroides cellulosilyticus]UVO98831.1 hypothetical protein NXV86_01930 [Bacteroides sp. BFG-257]
MNPILPFTALARVLRRTGFVLLLALSAGSCTTNDVFPNTATDDATLIRFDIAPRPGFTDRSSTRIAQTTDAAQWEEGDILWIRAEFYDNTNTPKTTYITALKRDGGRWRSLTYEEEAAHISPCTSLRDYYKNEIRWPKSLYGTTGTYCRIYARYLGQQYPDASGKIAVTPDIDVINIPNNYSTSYPGEVVELRFFQPLARLRITKACLLKFKSLNYAFRFPEFLEAPDSYVDNVFYVPSDGKDYFLDSEDKNSQTIRINGQEIQLLPDAQDNFKGMSYTIDPDALPSGPIAPEF